MREKSYVWRNWEFLVLTLENKGKFQLQNIFVLLWFRVPIYRILFRLKFSTLRSRDNCFLTEFGWAEWENIWLSVVRHELCCTQSMCYDLKPNILSSGPPAQSIGTYFWTWLPYLFSFLAHSYFSISLYLTFPSFPHTFLFLSFLLFNIPMISATIECKYCLRKSHQKL